MNVFFTVDVEIWCGGWANLDSRFPDAFKRYVYGPTPRGHYGLPHQLKLLNEFGFTGVFFVEPLFATRFGAGPLAELTELIQAANQEVQLHLHTEWVAHARQPVFDGPVLERQHLMYYSLAEQKHLVGLGKKLLMDAGAPAPNAFRAGSFGFNKDTLSALVEHGIEFDASYNATLFGPGSGVAPGQLLTDTYAAGEVVEFPMTVYDDGFGRLRHTQLTAVSQAEMEALLWQALERGQDSFMILSHNFELMNTRQDRPDPIVVRRFEWLCNFLDRNRDCFNVTGFRGLEARPVVAQPRPLQSSAWKTSVRTLQQVYRRSYG